MSQPLTKHHCEKLAVFFNLTPAERDRILNDAKPGEALIETLDERELVTPCKMIGLYEGLKASHLDKIGSHVMNYIEASRKAKVVKNVKTQHEKRKVSKIYDVKSLF